MQVIIALQRQPIIVQQVWAFAKPGKSSYAWRVTNNAHTTMHVMIFVIAWQNQLPDSFRKSWTVAKNENFWAGHAFAWPV